MDGWDGVKAYQFHGCVIHGCDKNCELTRGKTHNPLNKKPFEEVRAKTQEITEYLEKEVGVEVEVMWECEWKKLKAENNNIKLFLQKSNLTQTSVFGYKKYLSEDEILDKVKTGRFFGLVQCSLHTPDHLKDKFSDLPAIFKNTNFLLMTSVLT